MNDENFSVAVNRIYIDHMSPVRKNIIKKISVTNSGINQFVFNKL